MTSQLQTGTPCCQTSAGWGGGGGGGVEKGGRYEGGIRVFEGVVIRDRLSAPHRTLNSDTSGQASELNDVYCRFNTWDFSTERNSLTESLISVASEGQEEALTVTEDEVLRVLRRTYPNKSAGRDNVKPCLLKHCTDQLSSIFSVYHVQPVSVSM